MEHLTHEGVMPLFRALNGLRLRHRYVKVEYNRGDGEELEADESETNRADIHTRPGQGGNKAIVIRVGGVSLRLAPTPLMHIPSHVNDFRVYYEVTGGVFSFELRGLTMRTGRLTFTVPRK